jgi:hypothetical protein
MMSGFQIWRTLMVAETSAGLGKMLEITAKVLA